MGFLGDLFGGKTENKTETKAAPWQPQADQLVNIFGEAQRLYDMPGFQGDRYAGMTPELQNALNNGQQFYQGNTLPQTFQSTGLSQMNNLSSASGWANNQLNFMPKANLAAQQTSVGSSPYTAAQVTPQTANYQGAQGSQASISQVSPDDINQFVNSDLVNAQVNAATRDIYRDLGENQLTNNAASAAGTGNIGSSRRAVMDAIAMRGANDRAADVSATIRNHAYDQGASLASQNANIANQGSQFNAGQSNNMAQFNAGQSNNMSLQNANILNAGSQFNATTQNQAAQFNRSQQQQNNQFNAGQGNSLNQFNAGQGNDMTQFGASQQASAAHLLNQMGSQGANLAQQGYGMGVDSVNAQLSLADPYQQQAQTDIENDYFRYDQPWNDLSRYYSFIGGNNWGQNTTTTGTSRDPARGISAVGNFLSGLGGLGGGK